MSDTQLITNWICVATEGETVDKRFLERQWLIDAAETYDPNLYTALLWPEHERWYGGNLGEVLELTAEEDEAGIMKLYARLCPGTELISANRNGKLLFCSVEFTKDGNFRGTGRTYLEGLGVTDEPASVGTTRMRFNKKERNYNIGNSNPLVINEVKEIKMAGKNKSTWRSIFGIQEEDAPETTPDVPDDKLQALAEAVANLESRVSALETKTDETDSTVEDIQGDFNIVKGVVDTEEFARLRDNLPSIVKNFSKLDAKATKLPVGNPKGAKKPFSFL